MKKYYHNIIFASISLLILNQVYAKPIENDEIEIVQEVVQEQSNNDEEITNVEETKTVQEDNVCKENPLLIRGFDVYKGKCINGLANGLGRAEGNRGIYEGNFENGTFNGQGILTSFLDGQKYDGTFINGQRYGEFSILDASSGYNRVALFEEDKFVKWIDDVATYEDVNYQSTPNYNPTINISSSTTSNNVGQERQQPYIGMQTPYGTVVVITANTFTAEKVVTGSDGYNKTKTTQYPLYLLK